MDQTYVGVAGFLIFIGLMLVRVPVAFAMALVGTAGLTYVYGFGTVVKFIPVEIYTHTSTFTLSALPLFLLMGYLAFYADLSRDSFDAARAWFGKVPGGLAIATVYACAVFGACSGSSLAECAVFSKIAVPEMTSRGYNKRLALGVVASAGGLDVLIPPSIGLVIYGVLTETSIGDLLIAGILPGIVYAMIFALAIGLFCWLKPSYAPRATDIDTSWRARLDAVRKLWAVTLLFSLVLGSIYFGWATPDEAAGVGVVGSFLLVLMRRKFRWKELMTATLDAAKAGAVIFLLLGTASVFTKFIMVTGAVSALTGWIINMQLPLWGIIVSLCMLWIILGCFIDAMSMMILTLPLAVPLVQAHQVDMVWFGIVMTMTMVIGTVSPPFGLNCFVMKAALGDQVDLQDIFAGALPFVLLMFLIVAILIIFPQISLYLPNLMAAKR
jgi:tripartite ATP-independent transporter DctM subunit